MVDSNRKGSEGELAVRDFITSWWADVEPGLFARTPRSGGSHYAGEFDMAGDLMTKAERFPFCVEVKNRESWSLNVFLEGRQSPVWAWWAQVCRDAAKTDPARIPMLWFKKRRMPWFVMLPRELMRGTDGMPAPDVAFADFIFLEHGAKKSDVYLATRLLEIDPKKFARDRRARAG